MFTERTTGSDRTAAEAPRRELRGVVERITYYYYY